MDVQVTGTPRDDYCRLQEALNELSATQAQHSERIMRLEKRQDDGNRVRSVWGPSSPFPSALGSSHHDSALNPAAEAFRNFDAEPPNAMISSLTLDGNDDPRRVAASRANSVRFDESANNHYSPSRASIEIPLRTGSGLGNHPLSERSLSHRSDRGSTSGFGRANSFGLESSRLLGSINNSPRVSGNPPPGFFVLGPCPAIVRCWLTETFSNDSLFYVAVCTGSSTSSITLTLVQDLGLADTIFEENGVRKVKLLVYLTEARIHIPSSRSASPAPQVPAITAKFSIYDHQAVQDKSIQIMLGSDVLREHNTDILFSQDKIMLYDDDRNQLSVPLVRPENDAVYKNLVTRPHNRRASLVSDTLASDIMSEQSTPGIIGRPNRANSQPPASPTSESPLTISARSDMRRNDEIETALTPAMESNIFRAGDDSKSTTGSEKSSTAPAVKSASGVWSNSWRPSAHSTPSDLQNNMRSTSTGSYSRPGTNRPMKVLRPSVAKGMATATRAPSSNAPFATSSESNTEHNLSNISIPDQGSQSSASEVKTPSNKPNPVGSGTAFPWLSQGQPRKSTATK